MSERLDLDAAEVRGMENKDPWRKALLIVRNVEPDTGHGRPSGKPHDREVFVKVSAQDFARKVNLRGWGANVISRTLTAWNRAAEAGLVPPARDIVPGQEIESPHADWSEFYDGTEGDRRYPKGARRDRLTEQAESDGVGASKVLDIAKNTAAMAAAIKADPDVAHAAREAIEQAARIEYESRVIADGGRVPSLADHNQPVDGMPSTLAAVADHLANFTRLLERAKKAIADLVEYGPYADDSTEANEIRQLQFQLLDSIARAGVRS